MELNNLQGQTMNLGNLGNVNSNSSVASVGNVVSQPQVNAIPAQPVQPVQPVQPAQPVYTSQMDVPAVNMQPQVNTTDTEPATQVESSVPPVVEPITENKFRVKLDTLRTIINNVGKAAVYDKVRPLTTVIQLKFSEEGFSVIATDGGNTAFQKDTSVKFTDELSVAVDANLLKNLVSKLSTEYVEIVFNQSNRTVDIIADGKFTLQEVYDKGTGEAVNIELPYTADENSFKIVDINLFKHLLSKVSVFASNPSVNPNYSGIFCGNKICATDRFNIGIIENIEALSTEKFYLDPSFVDLLLNLEFGENTRIAVVKSGANDLGEAIIVQSNNAYLAGPVKPNGESYPIDTLNKILSTVFTDTVTVNKSAILATLDRVTLFVNELLDKDAIEIKLSPSTMSITSLTKTSDERLGVNCTTDSMPPFKLDLKNTIKAIKNIESDNVIFKVSPNNNGSIMIVDDNITEMLAIVND